MLLTKRGSNEISNFNMWSWPILFLLDKCIIFYFMWGTTWTQYPTNEAELTVTAVENVNRQITISCGFSEFVGRPYWFIQTRTYDLYRETYPMIQKDGLYTIIIQSPNICQNNNTMYQCITARSTGRVTRLIVKEGEFYKQITL